jgi:hypothetical protein
VYDIDGALWLVADNFANDISAFQELHCAPVFSTDAFPVLDLDVRISRAGGSASLGLLTKKNKATLTKIVTDATPSELRSRRCCPFLHSFVGSAGPCDYPFFDPLEIGCFTQTWAANSLSRSAWYFLFISSSELPAIRI